MAVAQVPLWLIRSASDKAVGSSMATADSSSSGSEWLEMDEEHLRSIPQRHPRIFRRVKRQSGADLGWVASAASNAFKLYSLVSSMMGNGGGGGGGGGSKDPNRIDTDISEKVTSTKEASAEITKQDEGLDEALGTLMAYGGQYLRKMALWGWEMATATPSEKIGDQSSILDSTQALSSIASVVVNTAESPLKKLSSSDLEKLGLKAVQHGANPIELQQAFAEAQLDGNWKTLEKLIVKALGSEAVYNVKPSTPILGSSGGSLPSTSSTSGAGGLTYMKLKAQEVMSKLNRVVNGYPEGSTPAYPGMSDTMLLRFVKEFQLEKEALVVQDSINSAILTFNNVFGNAPAASDKIDRPGAVGGSGGSTSSGGGGGLLATLFSLPQRLMALVTGPVPDKPVKKVDTAGGSYSEVQTVNPVGSLAVGAVGTSVVAGALYYLYNAYLESEEQKRRRRADLGTFNRRVDDDDDHNEDDYYYYYDDQFQPASHHYDGYDTLNNIPEAPNAKHVEFPTLNHAHHNPNYYTNDPNDPQSTPVHLRETSSGDSQYFDEIIDNEQHQDDRQHHVTNSVQPTGRRRGRRRRSSR